MVMMREINELIEQLNRNNSVVNITKCLEIQQSLNSQNV